MNRQQVSCGICKESVFLRYSISCKDCLQPFHLKCIPLHPEQRQLIIKMDANFRYCCALCEILNKSGLGPIIFRLDVLSHLIGTLLQQVQTNHQEEIIVTRALLDITSLLVQIICNNPHQRIHGSRLFGTNPFTPLAASPNQKLKAALFVTRLAPETTALQIAEYLRIHQNVSAEVTKLKTRHETYASFHILMNEWQLSMVVRPDVWPFGVLVLPFQGQLKSNIIIKEVENCNKTLSITSRR